MGIDEKALIAAHQAMQGLPVFPSDAALRTLHLGIEVYEAAKESAPLQTTENELAEHENRFQQILRDARATEQQDVAKSNEIFKRGDFLGFDESEQFVADILNSPETEQPMNTNWDAPNSNAGVGTATIAADAYGDNAVNHSRINDQPVELSQGSFNSHVDGRLTKSGGLAFDMWTYIRVLENKAHGNPTDGSADKDWQDYYENDYTPHAAIEEDFNYA